MTTGSSSRTASGASCSSSCTGVVAAGRSAPCSQGWTAGTAALLTEHGIHVEADLTPPVPPVEPAGPGLVRPAPARTRAPLPSTRPEPVAPTRPQPLAPTTPELPISRLAPTRPYPPYPFAGRVDEAGFDLSEEPTTIVASPTGAWPVWRRPGGAPATPAVDAGDAARGPIGGTRPLRVHPVARASRRAPLDLLEMDPYDFDSWSPF